MTLQELFKLAIQHGIDADPRSRAVVEQELHDKQVSFDELKPEEQATFDPEQLTNPYADSRILHGSLDQQIRKILVGIDIESPELLLADRLNEKGARIDLVLAHHPEGRAYANFYEVMKMQADILNRFGVPINVAEDQLSSRMKEVERGLMPANHTRPVDAARLLAIPYCCIHTPADNLVSSLLQNLFDREAPPRLKDILKRLNEIPEYQEARRNNAGPRILVGSDEQRTGRIFVKMTGGTSGSKETIEKLVQSGVGTLVAMHLPEEHRKEAEKHHLRVVIAGHISSDTLGLNLLLDKLETASPLDIVECSGFKRFKRSA